MQRLIIAAVILGLSLTGLANVAQAQEKTAADIITNADGSNVASRAGLNPVANGEGGTIIYGDITTGPGNTVIGAPTVDQTYTPLEPVPVLAPEPEYVPETTAPVEVAVVEEAAVAATDLDGDNYADAEEWALGLDPGNIDTDADGVADGDELTIYGTDPTVFDSDGDSIGDGGELFDSRTDPLVWDDFSAPVETTEPVVADTSTISQPVMDASITSSEALAQETTENVTATEGDAAGVGPGNASAAPGTVTRDGSGTTLLGPDGTYHVTDALPPNVSVSGNGSVTGDVEVIGPPAVETTDAISSSGVSCSSYGSWYDAQVAYEAAGLTAGDPAMVASLDPDYDGIACEEVM
jgi:hypothetical protein